MIGEKFNRLTVLSFIDIRNRHEYYLCRCDCGKERQIQKNSIVKGYTKSCGCYNKEVVSKTHKIHGHRNTRIYHIWENMKQRCLNSNSPHYMKYGGRGIGVCFEWLTFKNFLEWAEGNGYSKGLTLDREDNDLDYCPYNCRWITNMRQQGNKRNTRFVNVDGEMVHAAEYARRVGITRSAVYYQLNNGHL